MSSPEEEIKKLAEEAAKAAAEAVDKTSKAAIEILENLFLQFPGSH